jgi:HAE1 family hydrophobic/amphiphilic exporter-1
VTRVEDGFTGRNNAQVEVILNREKLNSLGLPAVVVAQTLAGVIGETEVTKFEREIDGSVRTVEVLLTNGSKPADRAAVADTVLLTTPQGVVKVSDVATVQEVNGFSGIDRLNGSRFVTVKAKVVDELKDAAAPQKAVKDFWTKDKLAEFNLREDALESRGSGDEFIKSFQDLFIALGIALLLLYVSLVIFLKSFSQPFIILFAVPLTFLGVFPALTLVGGQFGFLEILGIITLSGIVVNVGIFLLDLANQKRAEGMDYKQAIAEASGIRFRPIVLTKLTTLGGLLPLILFAPFWQSLATVVTAGVLVSGFLSLFTTPILYSWIVGGKQRITRGVEARRNMKKRSA